MADQAECDGLRTAECHLHFLDKHWAHLDCAWVRGNAFFAGKLLREGKLVERVAPLALTDEVLQLLVELNGFFSLILKRDKEFLLAVDAVRSIPLFYGFSGGTAFVSDDAYWIKEKTGEIEFDPQSTEEFLYTGYITGPDTLYERVKQVQAGELLKLRLEDGVWRCESFSYHRYCHHNPYRLAGEELSRRFQEILDHTFSRLITFAGGRPIVIPLSGGYDSRLVALMLKKLKYPNVTAFSYGRPGNANAEVSREVAERLGFPWLFVPYSQEDWFRWHRTEERRAYGRMADGLCTLPHTQDWPAVWELSKLGQVAEDSVFVPGHSADLLSGSRSGRIPKLYNPSASIQISISSILDLHYCLQKRSDDWNELEFRFRERILRILEPLQRFPDAASALESWEVQERQAKCIVNSVRVYEFWGYSWWLPFWDREFLSFWKHVPLALRVQQSFYRDHVESLYVQVTGTSRKEAAKSDKSRLRHLLGSVFRALPMCTSFRSTLKRTKFMRARLYDLDPLASLGILSRERFLQLSRGQESLATFEALERLGRLSLDGPVQASKN